MSPETRAKIKAKLKAYWTPERRKAHGEYVRQCIRDRLWERRYWEARAEGREMSEWPRPPASWPPSYTPDEREWFNRQANANRELQRWRLLERQRHATV